MTTGATAAGRTATWTATACATPTTATATGTAWRTATTTSRTTRTAAERRCAASGMDPGAAHPRIQLLESQRPAMGVAFARGTIEEALVPELEPRAAVFRPQRDGHERHALRRAVPGPAEHEPLVGHDLLVFTGDF